MSTSPEGDMFSVLHEQIGPVHTREKTYFSTCLREMPYRVIQTVEIPEGGNTVPYGEGAAEILLGEGMKDGPAIGDLVVLEGDILRLCPVQDCQRYPVVADSLGWFIIQQPWEIMPRGTIPFATLFADERDLRGQDIL